MIHMLRPLWEWEGVSGDLTYKWDAIGRRGWGLASVSDVRYFFFIKESWIYAMTRHHAEPNININFGKNSDSDFRLKPSFNNTVIPLRCLWAKLNNRARGKIECNMAWFSVFVLISFIHMHGAVVVPYTFFFFFIRKSFIRKWASKTPQAKEMLRKSPAWNNWPSIFKTLIFARAL